MSEPPGPDNAGVEAADSRRADAVASQQRILDAALTLAGNRGTTMGEIAAAAAVGRSTLYRHFPTRQALDDALDTVVLRRGQPQDKAGAENAAMPFRWPGQLGRDRPLTLEVTRILDEVPAHLVPEQLVAEARRVAGVSVALFVVDIDGSQLVRLAGSDEFPDHLDAPPAIGPEIVPEGLPQFFDRLRQAFPGCQPEPLWLRGRVLGLLLCIGTPSASLEDIAKQGAAALELTNSYTDFIEAARRRKPTTPAAEIQQNLFPPRIVRIAGAQLAGVLLPSYEVGGDWFDFVENRDGAWLAIADSAGKGATAAGLGAAALGALRAARRSGRDLAGAVELMDGTVHELGNPEFHITATVGRWHAATSTFTWVNCGHPPAYLVSTDQQLIELTSARHPALGHGNDEEYHLDTRQLNPGERLILLTDGITQRKMKNGNIFGIDGIRSAVEQTDSPTAALTAMAIQQAVTRHWNLLRTTGPS
jgi:AcrR family transcriptional regulator